MGIGRDGIMRFPRTKKRKKFLGVDVTDGRVPKGYDKLTRLHRRVAKLIVGGTDVKSACRKCGMSTNRYYRWLNYHKPFKEYMTNYARRQSTMIAARLDTKFGRAVSIVEESMDNPDPYFRHDVAVKYLSGRGVYKKNIEGKQVHIGSIEHAVSGEVGHKHEVVDKDMMQAFIDAITGVATGTINPHNPKMISKKVLKSLPEPNESNIIDVAKIQESVEAEPVRHTKAG